MGLHLEMEVIDPESAFKALEDYRMKPIEEQSLEDKFRKGEMGVKDEEDMERGSESERESDRDSEDDEEQFNRSPAGSETDVENSQMPGQIERIDKSYYDSLMVDYQNLKRTHEEMLEKESEEKNQLQDRVNKLEGEVKRLKGEHGKDGITYGRTSDKNETAELVVRKLQPLFESSDENSKRRCNRINNNLICLGKNVDLKMGGAGSKEREYTIPKVPTFKDMEDLKNSFNESHNKAKQEIIDAMEKQQKSLLKEVLKSTGAQSCGICGEYGHKSRECPKFDKGKFCRVCGDSYHVTERCVEDKKVCTKCGMKNSHNSRIHEITDKAKRAALIKETKGDVFDHFLTSDTYVGQSSKEYKDSGTDEKASSRNFKPKYNSSKKFT